MSTMTWSMSELQQCAAREVNMRRKVYPNRVLTGRMTQKQADAETAKMAAIADLLAEMADGEKLL